jgi:hypothetical protein
MSPHCKLGGYESQAQSLSTPNTMSANVIAGVDLNRNSIKNFYVIGEATS